jgi:hypothetical protein
MTDATLPGLEPAGQPGAERERLALRWLELTRRVLPGMAAAQGWPIRWDHCFMRVCLDNALGRPWHEAVRRPAIRWLELHQLQAAVAVAEGIAADPRKLPELNDASLAWRRAARHR